MMSKKMILLLSLMMTNLYCADEGCVVEDVVQNNNNLDDLIPVDTRTSEQKALEDLKRSNGLTKPFNQQMINLHLSNSFTKDKAFGAVSPLGKFYKMLLAAKGYFILKEVGVNVQTDKIYDDYTSGFCILNSKVNDPLLQDFSETTKAPQFLLWSDICRCLPEVKNAAEGVTFYDLRNSIKDLNFYEGINLKTEIKDNKKIVTTYQAWDEVSSSLQEKVKEGVLPSVVKFNFGKFSSLSSTTTPKAIENNSESTTNTEELD